MFSMTDVFGFAEHQENATYGLRYKFTLKRNNIKNAINRSAGSAHAKLAKKFFCYV